MKISLFIVGVLLVSVSANASSYCEAWVNSAVGRGYASNSSLYLGSQSQQPLDGSQACAALTSGNICVKGSIAGSVGFLIELLNNSSPAFEVYEVSYPDKSSVTITTIPKSADPYQAPANCEQDNGYDPCAEARADLPPLPCNDYGCGPGSFTVSSRIQKNTYNFESCQ